MPPQRWMIAITPEPETLGATLRRLRLSRGLSQAQVEEGTGIDQSVLSAYERGARVPRASFLRKLNVFYALPQNTLAQIAWEDQARRDDPETERLPAASVAIPNEPELVEAVRALFLLETDDLPHAARVIRTLAEGPLPRDEPAEEETG